MFVFVVFMNVLLQQIVFIFMRAKKFLFVKFCLVGFLFQINDRIFNRFLRLGVLVVSDVVDRSTCTVSIQSYITFIYLEPQGLVILSIFLLGHQN